MAVVSSSLKFGKFNITINYKPVKYLRLKVTPNGDISISAPFFTSKINILNLLNKNEGWLENTLAKIKSKDDKVKFLGNAYELKFDENIKEVLVLDTQIIASSKVQFDKFLYLKAKEIFQKYIEFYQPKISRQVTHVSIKKMSSRWGSCNSKKGYINLNLNLIAKDERFIEYVVLHEMAHLIYPHHQKSFYDFIQSLMPDYKIREKM
ncbi:M48 family metallopeptidase [Campylobacter hyointestinalis]|uniref:M48 family metallopeptidase n=1 Tax=Campylobacter hyointestinalis TaxID=198 RepID=UPI000DCB6005|nr:SprT family zinc-dependent metalloprotease [Campylobacter hyointestinalis]RAZ57220.1 M48 family peptidase [Campylobacter hyointestinalis subsp. lawsonii]RAZ65376.1 M48 family peptidase [Campylobacter hyointestinalis subsp. lawsonii]